MGKSGDLKTDLESWERKSLQPALERSQQRKTAATDSGIPVKALYTPADVEGTDYAQQIGFPGEYPYTRGVYPSMYRGQLWTMRQYAGFGTARETNRRFRYMIERGMGGINVAFDLPTQHGYDSDHPRARCRCVRGGIA